MRSHGWCRLAPFAWEEGAGRLERPLPVPGGLSRVTIEQPDGPDGRLRVSVVAGHGSRAGLDATGWAAVEWAVTRMLQLDHDRAEFEDLARREGGAFAVAVERGFGRLLRAPSLFEDMVKILATTNTTWGGTVAMVRNLVDLAGGAGFPSPAKIAALGPDRLASKGRWGYRARYLAGFADSVASGDIDLEAWERWQGPTADLEVQVRKVPGLGPYATAQVLMLIGRFDRIGIDTAFRSFVRQKYFPRARKPVPDRRMLALYEGWGEWRALAYWADLWLWHMERGARS